MSCQLSTIDFQGQYSYLACQDNNFFQFLITEMNIFFFYLFWNNNNNADIKMKVINWQYESNKKNIVMHSISYQFVQHCQWLEAQRIKISLEINNKLY